MSSLSKFTLCLALVSLPLRGACTDNVIVTAVGKVQLNGIEISRSGVIFPEDELTTGPQSAAVLHARGATLQVGPAAVCTLHKKLLSLESGAVRVSGTISIRSGTVTVLPDTPETSFILERFERKLRLTVIKGSVRLKHEKQTQSVAAGKSIELDAVPAMRSDKSKFTVVTVAAVGTATGATIAAHLGDSIPRAVSAGRLE